MRWTLPGVKNFIHNFFWWDLTFQKVKQSSSSECSTVDIAISEEEMVYEHEKLKHFKNGKKKINSFDHYIEIKSKFP